MHWTINGSALNICKAYVKYMISWELLASITGIASTGEYFCQFSALRRALHCQTNNFTQLALGAQESLREKLGARSIETIVLQIIDMLLN